MKRLILGLIIIAAICTFIATTGNAQKNSESSQRLPGVMVVIDASQFPSLQDAIDAIGENGGMVRIPPGTFEINSPLIIKTGDTCIEGSGTATHIKNVNTDGKAAIILQHPDGVDNRNAELWRIRIANLRITGNEKSGHGIEARRINEIYIEGVTISYHGGDGIQLYYCYEDPRICDSLITYNKQTGLNLIACHDIVVSSNQFEENKDALRCIDSFNLCMTGNNLDDHLGNGVVIENTYGSVVSGNMIEECNGTAIVLDRDCYGITLSANVIAHESTDGIDLRDAHGCSVSANTFTIMGKNALRIGPNSGRITVSANNFSNSYIGDDKVKRGTEDLSAGGLLLKGTSDIAIVGNLFSSVRPKGVSIEGPASERILLSNNVFVDADCDYDKLVKSVARGNLDKAD